MKTKNIITVALLLFVAASVAFIVFKETKKEAAAEGKPEKADNAEDRMGDKALVYYFFGNKRCTTCKKIEAYTHEAVMNNFATELKKGVIKWQAVNVEAPGNGHFAKEFNLSSKAVVIVNMKNGKQEKFKILDELWFKVGNKKEFTDYIVSEVKAYLEKGA